MNVKLLVVGLTLLGLAACAENPPTPPRAVSFAAAQAGPYRLGVDDTVDVSVWKNPDLSVTEPVRPDGKISVPLIGDVAASGLTPTQVASKIRNKLSYFIRDPQVAVIVTGMKSHEYLDRVRVTGAVRNPRSLAYHPGMTVLDAVLAAGGVNNFAAPNDTMLYRDGTKHDQAIPIHLGSILSDGRLKTNLPLRPGDIISVPERLF
ncbi:MAG: XrtA/PEP-CTERM system exopolysaccharide export protein [Acidiferrobacteraceae bacterium]